MSKRKPMPKRSRTKTTKKTTKKTAKKKGVTAPARRTKRRGRKRTTATRRGKEGAEDQGRTVGLLREVLEPNIAFAFHPNQADDEALVQRYLTIVLDAGAQQLIRQNRALMQRPDQRPHLPQLRCPVLVMCGENDLLTPPPMSREIAALVPGAVVRWVPECGHMLTMEKPRFVNAVLGDWLQQFVPPA